ncbi:MAG: hypothetical protein N2645_21755 [Clostridia bacterium]|nr:hypothetical protein [Clostridia bacterium]
MNPFRRRFFGADQRDVHLYIMNLTKKYDKEIMERDAKTRIIEEQSSKEQKAIVELVRTFIQTCEVMDENLNSQSAVYWTSKAYYNVLNMLKESAETKKLKVKLNEMINMTSL